MIHDYKHLPQSQTLQAMQESEKFNFYLTGSRYMGGEREDSDWDFMVQDSPDLRAFLTDMGFGANILLYKGEDGGGGTLTTAVWQKTESIEPGPDDLAEDLILAELLVIQVQIVPDVVRKLTVRDTIKFGEMNGFHQQLTREDRFTLWEMIARYIPVDVEVSLI